MQNHQPHVDIPNIYNIITAKKASEILEEEFGFIIFEIRSYFPELLDYKHNIKA